MAASAAVISAVVAGLAATGSAVQANQQKQQAKGIANAQKDQVNQQITDQKNKETQNLNQQSVQAGASQKAALDAIRASMSTSSAAGGTILSGPQGAASASPQGKTLLGV